MPLFLLLLSPLALHAQTQADDVPALATQVARDLADAGRALDQAFNLLGLLESFGFVVTVVGGAAAIFGVTRFIAAQNQLRESRQKFEEEIASSRRLLQEETRKREQAFASLQGSLQGALEKSTGDATRALSFLPLGERQYRSGDLRGARAIYERALQLDPRNPVINYRMGYACSQAGALDEAETCLRQALASEPDFAPALASLGYVYRRRAEQLPEGVERARAFNEAERHLTQALVLLPNLVDDDGESWWGSLGGLYRRRGQLQEAVHAYREAARVTPASSYAWVNLALLGMQQDGADAMRDTWRQAQQLAAAEVRADVDNYWGYADLVTTSLALGDGQQANEALESFFRTTPADASQVPQVLRDSLAQLAEALPEAERAVVQAVISRIEAQTGGE
ncbi:MAG: tetratricopeptide repeat protein [Anaerolineaceae bacterium]|nr:tetratricopeptide repeat protein [Anaerolineaceae bacterium]